MKTKERRKKKTDKHYATIINDDSEKKNCIQTVVYLVFDFYILYTSLSCSILFALKIHFYINYKHTCNGCVSSNCTNFSTLYSARSFLLLYFFKRNNNKNIRENETVFILQSHWVIYLYITCTDGVLYIHLFIGYTKFKWSFEP